MEFINLNAREEIATPASRPGVSGAKSRLSLLTYPIRALWGIYTTFGRKSLIAERDALIVQRNNLMLERDGLIRERNDVMLERDALIQGHNDSIRERDSLMGERARAPRHGALLQVRRQLERRSLQDARTEVNISEGAVLSHIRESIEGSTINLDPFPHLIVRNLFPPSLYSQMAMDLPSDEEWRAAGVEDYYRSLLQSGIDDMTATFNIDSVPESQLNPPMFSLHSSSKDMHTPPTLYPYATFWTDKYTKFIDFAHQVTLAKYQDVIASYYKYLQSENLITNYPKPNANHPVFFMWRPPGWGIARHTHSYIKILFSMIYFPVSSETMMQGTHLYRCKKKVCREFASFENFCEFFDDEVEPAGQLPYEPNTMVSVLNTPKSVHSSPHGAGPICRYIFMEIDTDYAPPQAQKGRSIDVSSIEL